MADVGFLIGKHFPVTAGLWDDVIIPESPSRGKWQIPHPFSYGKGDPPDFKEWDMGTRNCGVYKLRSQIPHGTSDFAWVRATRFFL